MKKIVVFFVCLLTSAVSHGVQFTCAGKADNLALSLSGSVFISLRNADNTPIFENKSLCNLKMAENGVEPSTCKGIYGMVLTSIVLNQRLTFWFDGGGACDPKTFAAWSPLVSGNSVPNGWYYGPQLTK